MVRPSGSGTKPLTAAQEAAAAIELVVVEAGDGKPLVDETATGLVVVVDPATCPVDWDLRAGAEQAEKTDAKTSTARADDQRSDPELSTGLGRQTPMTEAPPSPIDSPRDSAHRRTG